MLGQPWQEVEDAPLVPGRCDKLGAGVGRDLCTHSRNSAIIIYYFIVALVFVVLII